MQAPREVGDFCDSLSNLMCNLQQSVAPKCAGGCGFYGSPTTENYCSVCYKRRLSSMGANSVNAPSAKSSPTPTASEARPSVSTVELSQATITTMPNEAGGTSAAQEGAITNPATTAVVEAGPAESNQAKSAPASEVTQQDPSRCYKCNKRVGLLAFKCRCGAIFCRPHLHAEEHGCTFDYQSMARQTLESRNPKIVTEKLDRI